MDSLDRILVVDADVDIASPLLEGRIRGTATREERAAEGALR